MAVGIQEATGFFDLMLPKRERVVPDWPGIDHGLIPEPTPAVGDGIGGLGKINHGPSPEMRMKSIPPKPVGLRNSKSTMKGKERYW